MRVNKTIGIIGRKGSGKTYYTTNVIIPAYQKAHPNKLILIIDTLDHPNYSYIPIYSIDQMPTVGLYRLFGPNINKIIEFVQKYITNALVIFEDATKYIENRFNETLKYFIYDSKQKNVDIIFQFHGFAAAPPDFWRNVDWFVLFRCEHPKNRKSNLPNYDEILAAYEKVMKSKHPYPHESIILY